MRITSAVADFVNAAFHQNAVPLVEEIALDNDGEAALADVVLRVSSVPPVVAPFVLRIERIEPGALHYVRRPDLRLDAALLRTLVEGTRADLTVTVEAGGAEIARADHAIRLLPPSHWGGVGAAPELLAAFVRPNDPAVDLLLHEAARKLAAAGKSAAIDGYAGGTRARAWDLAAAIWAALADLGLAYVLPPASFERTGQKTRGPSDVVARRAATCLDTSLLYAACLEQAGLDALLVLTRGHAFVGLWLARSDLAEMVVEDAQGLRKRRDLQDLVLVETTLLTRGAGGRFAAAVEAGAAHVEEGAAAAFELAIDLRQARLRQIRPLDLGDGPPAAAPAPAEPAAAAMDLDEAPAFVEPGVGGPETPPERPLDRIERWKRKLLDLSLRNKMLNFKDAKRAVVIACPDAARFEEQLSAGGSFRLRPRLDGPGEDARRVLRLSALEEGDLYTDLAETDLEARVLELSRLAKTAFEEGGSNILFLAMGMLTWTQRQGGRTSRAPILLVPVSLTRTSVRAGFRLSLHDEEPRFNPTLLEMLRQDFGLAMPEFDRDLPTQGSGLALASIWQTLRTHVRDLKGWEVTTDVVLSTFSFAKFLMWRDLVLRMDVLKRSPVLRHLIDTPKQTYGDGADIPGPERIDLDYHPSEIVAPLSADSSQLAAVMAAHRGRDFVLVGPPGTGKSQTIANIIAQALAFNRTVLFVAQKTAALEVVQRRLDEIGLGGYCLEVHSAKARRSAVLERLRAAWHERDAPEDGEWDAATADLGVLRDDLNGLVRALHRRRENGLSAYEAFGRVVAGRDSAPALRFDWPAEIEHRPEDLARLRALCRALETALKAVGSPADHPLRGLDHAEWTPLWRNAMERALDGLASLLPRLDAAARAFAAALGLAALSMRRPCLEALLAFGRALTAPEAAAGAPLLSSAGSRRAEALAALVRLQADGAALRSRLAGDYDPPPSTAEVVDLMERWGVAGAANLFTRGGKLKAVRAALAARARGAVPEDIGPDLRVLRDLAGLAEAAAALAPDLDVFGALWRGLDTDAARLAAPIAWAERARAAASALAAASPYAAADLCDYMTRLWADDPAFVSEGGEARLAYDDLATAWAEVEPALAALAELAGPLAAAAGPDDGPPWIDATLATLERWRAGLPRAQAWCYWVRAAEEARGVSLGPVVAAVEAAEVSPAEIERGFDLAYARWWADRVVTRDATLRGFLPERHEDAVERFRRADDAVAALARRLVRARLRGEVPRPTAFGSDPEWGTLARELTKKARHLPLRHLFGALPNALRRLAPCMMMSPVSIAQYLPPDAQPFDLVIFDEASQMPAWDAAGALARARQAIVVGDPEQLPPTSVGERGIDESDDATDVEDQESILDECLASNIPALRLDWHYRSRHESLIAFSNHAYYAGRLITFPSADTHDRAVRLVPVPGGVYERGKGRTNLAEARAVVAEVERRLRDPAFRADRRSLGVVTFNGDQQRLIDDECERLRDDPALKPFFDAAHWPEPVIVKNLENVQGDERDVILFSVTFAPDEAGRGIAAISSLNREGGHRRLNVAITRARREMVIFATLRPDQIALSRTGSRGIRDFKHFLEFAERGPKALGEAAAPLRRGTDSPFEDAVMAELERRGWRVHPQVGVSAFRIDLGIVHPDAPGRYLAGVECDGATYHRAASARDRDRLRESVLRGLGWRIRRVWSTDWWMDASTAAERLHAALLADLAQDRAASAAALPEPPSRLDDADAPVAATDLAAMVPEPVAAMEAPRLYADAAPGPRAEPTRIGDYRRADLAAGGVAIDPARFHDADYRENLRCLAVMVIETEGPVFIDVLVGRVSDAHGFGRVGGRIRDVVESCVPADAARTWEGGRTILWPAGIEPGTVIPFRAAPEALRAHADVPLMELAGLARRHLDGAAEDEVVRRMAQALGLSRLRDATRARLHEALRLARVS